MMADILKGPMAKERLRATLSDVYNKTTKHSMSPGLAIRIQAGMSEARVPLPTGGDARILKAETLTLLNCEKLDGFGTHESASSAFS